MTYYYRVAILSFLICVLTPSRSYGLTINITPANFTVTTLNSISANDVINFSPGNYPMNEALTNAFGKQNMNGITFENTGTTPALFYSNTNDTLLLYFNFTDSLTLNNLSFDNVKITIRKSDNVLVTNCLMEGLSTLLPNESGHNLILFNQCSYSTIQNCSLEWTNASTNGKGIKFWRGSDNNCINNNITGFLRGGIDNADSDNFLVDGGFIHRGTVSGSEDHGIYIHDITSGTVKNVQIENFTPTSSGGSLKLKNVDHIEVYDNNFYGSGILLRIDAAVIGYRLEHIWIHHNLMDTTANISSWTPTYSPTSLLINDNCLKDGYISISSATATTINTLNDFTNTEGGVFNNNYTSSLSLSDVNINNSGNILSTPEFPIDCPLNTLSIELINFEAKISSVEIYPNPSSNTINIEANESERNILKIYNVLGLDVTHLIKKVSNSDTNTIIDISDLVTGIYYVRTKTATNKVQKY